MIYAKTWCPAYPCDPCVLNFNQSTLDQTGTEFPVVIPDTDFCPIGGGLAIAPKTSNRLQVFSYSEEAAAVSYFKGVRKWGLLVQLVPGSDPKRFGLPVTGGMTDGAPLPLGPLTVSYGGTIVLSVSGPIQGITPVGPGQIQGDGRRLVTFTGFIELPSTEVIQAIRFSPYGPLWQWHYRGPAMSDPQTVTIKWRWPGEFRYACNPLWNGHNAPYLWNYGVDSRYFLEWVTPYLIFYRTKIDEMGPTT